jgi:hypothetical protein
MEKVLFFIVVFMAFFLGCEPKKVGPEVPTTTTLREVLTTTTTQVPVEVKQYPKLSWNSDKNPERQKWTEFLVEHLSQNFDAFDKAKDWKRFCPKYESLKKGDKILVQAETMVWIMWFESAWKPTSRMQESQKVFKTPDPITGQPVASEGLFQLSYQDVRSYPFCNEFDWSKDKGLAKSDPNKTIFDPIKNMRCGLKIMEGQITKRGQVILQSTKGLYWAVIYEGGKYQQIPGIISRVRKAMNCK